MPTAKPSEKTGHEGEWWRDDKSEHSSDSPLDPDKGAHSNRTAGKNKFDQEQEPTKHPV
jgi:hypothetical protein